MTDLVVWPPARSLALSLSLSLSPRTGGGCNMKYAAHDGPTGEERRGEGGEREGNAVRQT